MEVLLIFLKIIFFIDCIFLIVVVLFQSHQGSGLAALGGGGTDTMFGTKAGTFLAKVTACAAALFILIAILLSVLPQKVEKGVFEEGKTPAKKENKK